MNEQEVLVAQAEGFEKLASKMAETGTYDANSIKVWLFKNASINREKAKKLEAESDG